MSDVPKALAAAVYANKPMPPNLQGTRLRSRADAKDTVIVILPPVISVAIAVLGFKVGEGTATSYFPAWANLNLPVSLLPSAALDVAALIFKTFVAALFVATKVSSRVYSSRRRVRRRKEGPE